MAATPSGGRLSAWGFWLTVAVSAGLLIWACVERPWNPDAFWHLQTGADLAEKGLSPWVDHYSISFRGEPISAQPVVFQLLLYGLVEIFGLDGGFAAARLIGALACLGLFIAYARSQRSPLLVAALAVAMVAVLLAMRAMVRPEIFSYVLSVAAMWLYARSVERPSHWLMGGITLLMLFWVNHHYAIMGYIIFAGLFLQLGVDLVQRRHRNFGWTAWLAWGLAVLATGFVHYGLQHPIWVQLNFPQEWDLLISEYQAPVTLWQLKGLVVALVLASLASLLLAVKLRAYGYLLILVVLLWQASQTLRVVTPAGIVMLCILVRLAAGARTLDWGEAPIARQPAIAGGAAAILIVATLHSGWLRAADYRNNKASDHRTWPVATVDYLLQQPRGNIFNHYRAGGFLIERLDGQFPVFIDGRTEILYPVEFVRDYHRALASPARFTEITRDLDIEYVLMKHSEAYMRMLSQVPDLGLDFADHQYALFRRGDARFSVGGLLLGAPECYSAELGAALLGELRDAQALPQGSAILEQWHAMAEFADAADPVAWLRDQSPAEPASPTHRLFLAQRAYDLEQYELAYQWAASVPQAGFEEGVLIALSTFSNGELQRSANMVSQLLQQQWGAVLPTQVRILRGLVEALQRRQQLDGIPPGLVQRFLDGTAGLGSGFRPEQLQISQLCQQDSERFLALIETRRTYQ